LKFFVLLFAGSAVTTLSAAASVRGHRVIRSVRQKALLIYNKLKHSAANFVRPSLLAIRARRSVSPRLVPACSPSMARPLSAPLIVGSSLLVATPRPPLRSGPRPGILSSAAGGGGKNSAYSHSTQTLKHSLVCALRPHCRNCDRPARLFAFACGRENRGLWTVILFATLSKKFANPVLNFYSRRGRTAKNDTDSEKQQVNPLFAVLQRGGQLHRTRRGADLCNVPR